MTEFPGPWELIVLIDRNVTEMSATPFYSLNSYFWLLLKLTSLNTSTREHADVIALGAKVCIIKYVDYGNVYILLLFFCFHRIQHPLLEYSIHGWIHSTTLISPT